MYGTADQTTHNDTNGTIGNGLTTAFVHKFSGKISGVIPPQRRLAAVLIIIFEIAYLIYSLFLFLVPEADYSYTGKDLLSEYGIYMENLGESGEGYYLDNGIQKEEQEEAKGEEEDYTYLTISTPEIDLPRGSWEITICYSSNYVSQYTVSSLYNSYTVTTGHQFLGMEAAENGTCTFTQYTPFSVEGYQVSAQYMGTGYLYISSISIAETAIWKQVNLFLAITVFLLADILFLWYYGPKVKKDPSRRAVAAVLAAIILFASLPVFRYFLTSGHDLEFHLYRIEAIKNALLDGQFPVRAAYSWANNYGYPTSVFYGDIFLYLPALLRMIGFTVQDSYKIFLVLVNTATCCISWYCFRRVGGDKGRLPALIGCMLYTLSPYRLNCMYLRAAVGETTAMIFLPLVFYGIWRIYMDPIDSPRYRYNWTPAVLGYSGIILSHMATTLFAGIFTVVVCVVLLRRTLQPRRLLQLTKIVIMTVLLCLWFLIPFADYMRFDLNVKTEVFNGMVQANAIFPGELFEFFPNGSGVSVSIDVLYSGEHMNNEMSYTLGAGLMSAAVIWLMICLYGRYGYWCENEHSDCTSSITDADNAEISPVKGQEKKNCRDESEKTKDASDRTDGNMGLGSLCMVLGSAALVMATTLFPWDLLQQSETILSFVAKNIQYPWRLLSMGSLFFAVVAVCAFVQLRIHYSQQQYVAAAAVVILTMISSGYYLSDYMNNADNLLIQEESQLEGTTTITATEYFPVGTSVEIFEDTELASENRLSALSYVRDRGTVIVSCINETDSETYVDLPVLYYRDYRATDDESGEVLTVVASEINRVRVIIPVGYSGTFRVRFTEPWYWRMSELISLSMLIILTATMIRMRRQSNK